MNNKWLWVVVLFTLVTVSRGQQSAELNQLGTSMANFLKIGIGARATAMGNAFVAVSDDISAIYWNPAGLGRLSHNSVLFQTTDWLLESKFYFFAFSFRLGQEGILGFNLNSFSSGDIRETTIWEPEGTGRVFDTADLSAGLTYSRQITDRFSAGVTIKYINERLDREKASTVAIDIGGLFISNFLHDMRLGFALSNLGGRMQLHGTDLNVQYLMEPGTKYVRSQLGTEPWDIPLLFRFGLATDVIRTEDFRLTVATEVMDSRDFSYRINNGVELGVRDLFFLRGGYKVHYDQENMTLGAGFNFSLPGHIQLELDYAYSNFGILENIQMFSIILRL